MSHTCYLGAPTVVLIPDEALCPTAGGGHKLGPCDTLLTVRRGVVTGIALDSWNIKGTEKICPLYYLKSIDIVITTINEF